MKVLMIKMIYSMNKKIFVLMIKNLENLIYFRFLKKILYIFFVILFKQLHQE